MKKERERIPFPSLKNFRSVPPHPALECTTRTAGQAEAAQMLVRLPSGILA
ncbi:MAG: hypothetical protein LBQ50_07705 [Planctomycetaceae bacterium]|nr:hypothetical protein [Planctomycetaceae bacterium]